MTSITISQKEIEEKICKLEAEESYGARWRICASFKVCWYVYCPISHERV